MFDFDVVTGPTHGTSQPAPASALPTPLPARQPVPATPERREEPDARRAA